MQRTSHPKFPEGMVGRLNREGQSAEAVELLVTVVSASVVEGELLELFANVTVERRMSLLDQLLDQ